MCMMLHRYSSHRPYIYMWHCNCTKHTHLTVVLKGILRNMPNVSCLDTAQTPGLLMQHYHQQLSHVLFCAPWIIQYNDVIMGPIASQITSLTIAYSIVYSDADQRKHQSSSSLAFVRGIHRGPVNSSHKWPVTRKMFPFDDVIMFLLKP